MCLSLVSLWVPGWASAEVLLLVSMEAVGASPSPPSGQVRDDCLPGRPLLPYPQRSCPTWLTTPLSPRLPPLS